MAIPQTSYGTSPGKAYAGMLADAGASYKRALINEESSGIPFGIGLARGTTEDDAKLPAAATDELAGIAVHSHAYDQDGLTGTAGIPADTLGTVLAEGSIVVKTEQSMAPGDPVYVRFAVTTTEQKGAFRKDADSGKARLVKGARVLKNLSSTLAVVFFSAAADNARGEEVEFSYDHAAVSADTTVKLWKNKSTRHFLIEEVEYINPTGLAQDASNTFNVKVLNAAAVAASWDTTTTTGQGTIAADTFVALVNGSAANRLVAPSAVVSLFLDEGGTASLPAGRIVVKGRYI